MRDDDWKRVLVTRADVDKVNVDSVDVRHKLRERIQRRFNPAPVVTGAPVLHEGLHLLQLDSLRSVRHCLLVGPASREQAAAQIGECRVRNIDGEGADRRAVARPGRRGGRYSDDWGGETRQSYERSHVVLLSKVCLAASRHRARLTAKPLFLSLLRA